MYPDTDKVPVILSNDMIYRSATFVKFGGKEHLAAACLEDGCLHLWDIKSKTYRTIFDPKLPEEKRFKSMNICKIDDSTIGYGKVYASLEGSRRVFILRMDTAEDLALCKTLMFFTPDDILDMCHAEMLDGTACLLLCTGDDHIMAVEIEDGNTRWEAGKEEMGEKFEPRTIWTDQNNCAYVADFGQDKVHLFSVTDGMLIKWFDFGSYYGFVNIFTVRFQDQHLYIERKIDREKAQKYAIMKFKLKDM